jgi:protein-tyrosine phosphatase
LIDIHSHIIPGIDDGSSDMSESIEMLREAARGGVTLIVATPHCFSHSRSPRTPEIARGLEKLAEAASSDKDASKVKLAMGAEIMLDPGVREVLDQGGIPPLGGRGVHILVELPILSVPKYTENTLFQLKAYGYVPIIAHPERNHELSQDLDMLCHLINMGVLVQMDAGSIVGAYGRTTETSALTILNCRMCHFVASDAHRSGAYRRLLPGARRRVASLSGEETANALFRENPMAVLEGRTPEIPEPIAPSKPKRRRGLAELFKMLRGK